MLDRSRRRSRKTCDARRCRPFAMAGRRWKSPGCSTSPAERSTNDVSSMPPEAPRRWRRGRRPGKTLPATQAIRIRRLVINRHPELLPFALWTREAVQRLIARECGVAVSIRTVGRYLKTRGFTPQKPARLGAQPARRGTLVEVGVPRDPSGRRTGKRRDLPGRRDGPTQRPCRRPLVCADRPDAGHRAQRPGGRVIGGEKPGWHKNQRRRI